MTFEGLVVWRLFGKGSKSEHLAVSLKTPTETFMLRRLGGNAFRDSELDKLVGKRIACEGTLVGSTIIMTDFKEVKKAKAKL